MRNCAFCVIFHAEAKSNSNTMSNKSKKLEEIKHLVKELDIDYEEKNLNDSITPADVLNTQREKIKVIFKDKGESALVVKVN